MKKDDLLQKRGRIGNALLGKIWKIMRLTGLFLLISFVTISAETYSQNTRFSFKMENSTLNNLFLYLEQNSGYRFAYNKSVLDDAQKISCEFKNESIDQILKKVLDTERLSISIKNGYIIITGKENADENSLSISQPAKNVSGRVTDSSGAPLPGVSVVLKGTTNGTITDSNGNYSISNVSEKATLLFSFVGMKAQEEGVGAKTKINVTLIEETIGIEEVVAIGYGTMKKNDLTGSVSHVDVSKITSQSSTNLLEMFAGSVSGLYVNQATTAQGGGSSLLIRGQKSIKASNDPLIVLDGVIYNGPIGSINPMDIESVDVLKDASSAAVYGARAAAGVIIVTTKRGKSGEPSLNFASEFGIASVRKTMRPLNPDEYIKFRSNVLYQMTGNKPLYYYTDPNNLPDGITLDQWKHLDATVSDDPIDMWLNRLSFTPIEKKNYIAGNTIDWFGKSYRNGIRQDYNLSLSGGAENMKYYLSAGYTKNQGIALGDDYDVFRSKFNLDVKVNRFLKINADINYSHRNLGYVSVNTSITGVFGCSPYGDMYNADGTLTWYPNGDTAAANPFVSYTYSDKYNPVDNLFATFSAELTLPFGIKYKPTITNNLGWNRDYMFDPIETLNGYNNNGYGYRSNSTTKEWMIDNLISWQKTIAKKHDLSLTFLYNIEKNQSWYDNMSNSKFSPNDNLSYHNLSAGTSPSISNNDVISTGTAMMGRINYSLLNKYLLTLTLRRDGYSAFGQDNPYALFPSAAIAWRISEENFFNKKVVNNLKLRLSWGANGNRSISPYAALANLGTLQYIYGTQQVTGVFSTTMANSNLKWETTKSFNSGVDFGVLNNKISGSIDGYLMSTTDLLIDRALPGIIGYSSVAANLGELENRGFELTINSSNINHRDFSWNSSLSFSFNRNKIKHLYGDMKNILDASGNVIGQKESDDVTNQWFIGKSIDRVWDYERIGIWQKDEADKAAIYGKKPGDIKLKDQNGDGVLNPTDDKIFQGYTRPPYRLGLNNNIQYKNFELSFFIRADLGFYRVNPLYQQGDGLSISRRNIMYFDFWSEENPSNEYPRLNANSIPSFNVWKNSSFVRVQDVSLSYNFPKHLINTFKMKQLKAYVNLRNLLTITSWNNWDPESGTTPMPKYITFGINANL